MSDPPPLAPSPERIAIVSPGRDLAQLIARSVADANAGKIDEIRFLPGEYEMAGGLVFEKPFGQSGLRISGAGVGLTRLVFNNEPTAILVHLDTDIRETDASPAFSIEGVSCTGIQTTKRRIQALR